MIEISRKVEEPCGFCGSTGWRLPEIVTPLCNKPQTTVVRVLPQQPMCCPTSCHPGHSLCHSEHAYKWLPQGWFQVWSNSRLPFTGPDSVPKTLSGFWDAGIPRSNQSFLALLTYQRPENIKTWPANPNPAKELNLTHLNTSNKSGPFRSKHPISCPNPQLNTNQGTQSAHITAHGVLS